MVIDTIFKSYFDRELKTTLSFGFVGIIVGYISFLLNNSPLSFFLMVVVAAAFMLFMKRVMKINEEFRWWLGNGLIVYIFLWLIVWTIFYNI